MQYLLGFQAKIFVGTAGAEATTEAKNVKDVTVNLESSEVDATTRATGQFKVYIPGQIDASVEFKMNADAEDSALSTIRTAWLAREAISTKVELGDGMAFSSDMIITSFSNEQTNDDIIAYSVTMKPTITTDSFVPSISASASN